MCPVYEHTTLTKRSNSFDPQSLNLLREDSICMVNLLEIPRMVVFFVNDMIEMLRLFRGEAVFCQATMRIKMSPLWVHCQINSI